MKTVSTENLIAHLQRVERNPAAPGHKGAAKVARHYLREARGNARKDLGRDLGGYGLVDLLADNLPLSLDAIDRVILVAGLASEREWINKQRKVDVNRAMEDGLL